MAFFRPFVGIFLGIGLLALSSTGFAEGVGETQATPPPAVLCPVFESPMSTVVLHSEGQRLMNAFRIRASEGLLNDGGGILKSELSADTTDSFLDNPARFKSSKDAFDALPPMHRRLLFGRMVVGLSNEQITKICELKDKETARRIMEEAIRLYNGLLSPSRGWDGNSANKATFVSLSDPQSFVVTSIYQAIGSSGKPYNALSRDDDPLYLDSRVATLLKILRMQFFNAQSAMINDNSQIRMIPSGESVRIPIDLRWLYVSEEVYNAYNNEIQSFNSMSGRMKTALLLSSVALAPDSTILDLFQTYLGLDYMAPIVREIHIQALIEDAIRRLNGAVYVWRARI